MSDDTSSEAYARRLQKRGSAWWKRLFRVQAIYRWNLRRLEPGFTLDVGCGIGRNLDHLDGNGVGVDHNPASVAEAQRRGYTALTAQEFATSAHAEEGRFDSILLAHVVEHMTYDEAVELVRHYLPFVAPNGKAIFICPQESGFKSDSTHVEFADFESLRRLCEDVGLKTTKTYSFPFPRFVGRFFRHNETVVVGRR